MKMGKMLSIVAVILLSISILFDKTIISENCLIFTVIVSVLFTMLIFEAKHQKELKEKEIKNQFELATKTHIAALNYDRYMEFCEKYIEKIYQMELYYNEKRKPEYNNNELKEITGNLKEFLFDLIRISNKYTYIIPGYILEELCEYEDGIMNICKFGKEYDEKNNDDKDILIKNLNYFFPERCKTKGIQTEIVKILKEKLMV